MTSIPRPIGLEVTLTDVKGDGNCFWYSLEGLTSQSSKKIKKASCAVFSALKPHWLRLQDFCSETLWEELTDKQDVWHHSANEVAVCAAAIVLDRPIIIISDAAVSLFSRSTPDYTRVQHALVLSLHAGHFQYSRDQVPQDIIETLLRSAQNAIPSMKGGGQPPGFLEHWQHNVEMAGTSQLPGLEGRLSSRDGGDGAQSEIP